MADNETGIAPEAQIIKMTVIHLQGGLTARMRGDATKSLKAAKGWSKQIGVADDNDIWIWAPDIKLMEVAEGRVERTAQPNAQVPPGEFRPVDLNAK